MAMKKRTDILIPIGVIAVLAALVLTIFLGFQRQNWIRRGEQLTAEVSAAIPKQTEAGIADGTGEVIPVLEIDGTDCAGLLSFPEYEKSWAVGSPYTDINLCPVVIAGSPKGKDLVINGSRRSDQFGFLESVETDDLIVFEDFNGDVWTYQVIDTAVRELDDDLWDLAISSSNSTVYAVLSAKN